MPPVTGPATVTPLADGGWPALPDDTDQWLPALTGLDPRDVARLVAEQEGTSWSG